MEKLNKKHLKNVVILTSCLFVLIIGFQNCGKKKTNQEGGAEFDSSIDLEVTGIENSTIPRQSWTWDCNNAPCEFRFVINESSAHDNALDDEAYSSDNNTAAGSDAPGEGEYYLHIQAKKDVVESEVKTVSIVVGQEEVTPSLVDQVDTSGSHACSLKDGYVKCWGLNDKGQLGYGDTDNRGDGPDEISGLADVSVHETIISGGTEDGHLTKFIATGDQHTCALLKNECVKCWGNNEYGQLGYGDTDNRGDDVDEMGDNLDPVGSLEFKVKTVATGLAHTCSITKTDTVRCWGGNDQGQLGQGSTDNLTEPSPDVDIHNDPDEQDQAIIAGFLPKHVAAGAKHTCAMLNNDCVKCWGGNEYGQLGYGDMENRGDDANDLVTEDVDEGEMGLNLLPVGGMEFKVKAIATGDWHTCAIMKSNDSVQCWGLNDEGQLGVGSTQNIGDAKDAEDKVVFAPVDLGNQKAKSITAGARHTCVTLEDDSTKCWGLNKSGQLGQGSIANIGSADGETGTSLPAIPIEASSIVKGSVVAGGDSTCFKLDDGKVKCWGNNDKGQLAKEHICSLGNGLGYSVSSTDQCNSSDAEDVVGTTVDQIEYLSFE